MTNGWPGLPPVDLVGWSDFQRKRLQQLAQERIAQAGAVASDWGSEAQRRIEDITGQIGAGVAGAAGGTMPTLDQPSSYQPATPWEAAGAAANRALRAPGDVIGGPIGRVQEASSGASGALQGLGVPEGVADVAGFGAGVLGAPGAVMGSTLEQAATRAGVPGAELQGDIAETLAPFPGTRLGPLTGLRTAGLVGGTAIGAGVGAATAPEDDRFGGAARGAATGLALGPDAADLAQGLARGATRLPDAVRAAPDWTRDALERIGRYGAPPQEAMGVRAGRPPTGPSAPGAGMTPDELQQRVRDAEEAIHLWQGEQTPEYDYVARLLRAGQEGEVLPEGTTDWNALIGAGRIDPDALNRALVAYREEGLSKPAALARAIGSAEERAANLQVGAAGVRDPSGLTPGLLNKAIQDLARDGRPFVTTSEGGAFQAGRNEPPNPAGKKPAWEYVDKNGRSQWLSTPYEVLFAKQLDANPDVAYWMQSSPEAVMETTVRHGGTPKVFTPDFIVVGTDGRIQVVEIKNIGAYRQVTWRVPEKLREAEEFFNSKGVGFSIFVEDQLGRVAAGKARPEDFLPDANGRSGVVNGFFVESEEGSKVGRFDPEAARGELARRLREAGGSWDLNELGYLSGYHPVTQEQYDELLAAERWPKWSGRMERGRIGRPDRRMALITPDQRRKIAAAGVGGVHPAEGGYGYPYEFAEPVRPEQGGYDPRWTAHRAYAEFNERQRRKGAPSIATDAVETYPQMLRRVGPIREEWGRQVADGQHGMSIDPVNGAFGVPGRYAVSIYPDMGLEFKGSFDQVHPDRLAMFMAEAEPILKRVPGSRVGVWYDSSEDTTFLDISVGVDSLKQAKSLGERMSQKAIFDSVAKQDIGLRYPGYAPGEVPPPPPRQEQNDAIRTFTRAAARSQRRGAAVPGAAALRGDGGTDRPLGPGRSGGPGGLGRGVAGAGAPGPAGAAGPGGPGLGGLEPGGVGGTGADDAPFGSYPPPVPYAGAAGTADGAAPDPGGRAAGGPASGPAAPGGAPGAPTDLGIAAGTAGRDGAAGDWRSALDAALATVRPYGAARTGGERALDLAAGTAGGVAGAATADEDAGWQERAGRFAAGATAASLAGPTARGGLGLLARGARNAEPLGATVGQRARRAQRAAAQDTGRVKLSDVPAILGSVPLMAPSSLGANFTGGMARSLERVLGEALELRPVDAATDLLHMLREIPGAASRLKANTLRGPTEGAQGAMGAPVKGDLSTRGGALPGLLTSGVRVNSATDQFWRDLNEAGARAVAGRRGLGTAQANKFATKAGDFATFTGTNSVVATKLTEMKQALRDPNANAGDKAVAGIVTAMAPYIMMPERLLRATVLAPVESGAGFLGALKRGDKAAMREAAGRFGASVGTLYLLKSMYDQRQLTGDPPQDANERRRREAQGEQWNTLTLPGGAKVPTRYFGSVGMQASMVASIMDAGARAEARGADPGAVWEARGDELAGWALDNSYLSDLSDFLGAVSERRFGDAARQTAAGTLARPIPLVPGIANAADPYEREPGTFPEMVEARTGLRSQVPTRIDPTTGEDQRRKGSGWSRYWGERGTEMTPEGTELARLGLQPSVLGRTEEYEGAKQTPEQRRVAQRALGSETGRAVRAAMATGAYREADDATKKSLLQAALREASRLADIKAGEQVARSPAQQAQRAWDAVPKYQGVDGTPDEIRRQNAAIATAKAAQAAAKRRGDAALDRWERENPAQADLAATKPENPRYLALDKEDIETQYGVKLP